MNAFNNDYYAILGVDADASPTAIKQAFKKLALQYHPDVYKGEDAHERMRLLLLAYQTLNDPVARKRYDLQRAEHLPSARRVSSSGTPAAKATATTTRQRPPSPQARRDRQRHYAFPDLRVGQAARIDLGDMVYSLSEDEARALLEQGMLRGIAPEAEKDTYYCHRCHHRWAPAGSREEEDLPASCPACRATDWMEYLLLRCVHCCAVFESEQIRYEIGSYAYGKRNVLGSEALCPPYELFPLCPYCSSARWCPAEDKRVHTLRQRAAQQAALWRMIWIGVALVAMVVIGVVALGVLR
ncbi:J domain-containing protein [Ktedonosporobacter rubrisoli]|uniref:J domain-containing protein n=1 Tax=Ktedonosporobacter rubrisoli TaxID=2509675 RepID=A0A4P6JVP4_KTERU|nr:J domain-containing protein [Ktedonosporobacter rubrisoli]QBD79046.1 J domain-containing protein [Ktedonosporobacter rubrisoli]